MDFSKISALRTPDWAALTPGEGGAVEVRLYGVIGETWYGDGTSARKLCNEIEAATPTSLTVRINSPGGSVTDGLTIYNFLRGLKSKGIPVTTVIDGMAASIASVIALAGAPVVMNEAAFFHIHNPFGYCEGRVDEMRAAAEDLEKVTATLAGVYTAKTGKTEAEIRDLMTGKPGFDGTLFTSAEALVAGFIDEIDRNAVQIAAFSPDLWKAEKVIFDAALTPESPVPAQASDQSDPSDQSETAPPTPTTAPTTTTAADADAGLLHPSPASAQAEVTPEAAPAEAQAEEGQVLSVEKGEEPQIITEEQARIDNLTAELATAKSQLAALQARVMGPAPAADPAPATWREAVANFGYLESKKRFPELCARCARGESK